MVVVAHKIKARKPLKRKLENGNGQKHAPPEIEENSDEEAQQIPKETLIVLQELNIARELGGNDAVKRNQQVRKLRRWLYLRAQSSFPFTEENYMRLWKGLYYCMYMADKPLYQEQLAENIGQLLHCFAGKIELSVEFFAAFLNTMRNEWFGIDQWRMDKFYMLMRRMLRHMLQELCAMDWAEDIIPLFNEAAQKTVLAENGCAMAMTMHYMDIMFEELAKVSEGKINEEQVNLFVEPFLNYLITQTDVKLFAHCRSRIFHHLLYQSALGRDYQDKYEAWKRMGFPATINDLEKLEAEEEADEEEQQEIKDTANKCLDPRAGNVDVFVPELPLNAATIVARLEQVVTTQEMPAKRRKMLKNLLKNFESYQNGEFPLGVKTMPRFKAERESEIPLIDEKVEELAQTEAELYGVSRKLKKLNKRNRRKLLKSLNFENVQPEELDEYIEKALPKTVKQQRLKKARQTLMKGWLEEVIDEAADQINENKLKKKLKIKQRFEKLKLKRKQKRTLAASPAKMQKMETEITTKSLNNAWQEPLSEGEVEYFMPSRKIAVKSANLQLARSPLSTATPLRGKSLKLAANNLASPRTPVSAKRVKIALNHNSIQKPSDYIKQIKNSPDVPYDASKKPGKGLLKPNTMPSPVDPFYMKRHSLKLKR